MAGRLSGKVALISGAARGMGESEACLFAREGAQVVLGDILEDQGRSAAENIAQQGGTATFVPLDVTREQDWQRAVETVEQTYGRLDILVNNAGIVRMAPLDETSLEAWNEVIGVNQTGVFLGMKHAVPAMRRAGGGSIVNISSIAGLIGLPNIPAYQASKGAVRLLTKKRRDPVCAGQDSGQLCSSRSHRNSNDCPAGPGTAGDALAAYSSGQGRHGRRSRVWRALSCFG